MLTGVRPIATKNSNSVSLNKESQSLVIDEKKDLRTPAYYFFFENISSFVAR